MLHIWYKVSNKITFTQILAHNFFNFTLFGILLLFGFIFDNRRDTANCFMR